VRLDVHLQDAGGGEMIAMVSQTGSDAQLPNLVTRVGAELRVKCGLQSITELQAAEVKASTPGDAEAARLYAQGLDLLRTFDALAARDRLQKAAIAEPGFPLVHQALAEAWSQLGYANKAKESAQRAFDLSARLSGDERAWVEASYRMQTHEWDKAVALYQDLFQRYPDNVEYGLKLVAAQIAATRLKEVAPTLAALRALPAPTSNDPRIDLAESDAADSTGDYKRSQSAAGQAGTKARRSGARVLLAAALQDQGWAYMNLGMMPQAIGATRESIEIYGSLHHRYGQARSLGVLGTINVTQGKYAEGIKLHQQALRIAQAIGNKGAETVELSQIANAMYARGDLEGARKSYQQAAAIFHELGRSVEEMRDIGNLATVLYDEGDLNGAEENYRKELSASREMGDQADACAVLGNLANIMQQRGDLGAAKENYAQGLALCQSLGQRDYLAYDLDGMGELQRTGDDLAGARQKYEAALELRRKIGDLALAAFTELDLAQVALDQGREQEARALVEHAEAELSKEQDMEGQIAVAGMRAELSLQKGDFAGAVGYAEQGQKLLRKSRNRIRRLDLNITEARALSGQGLGPRAKLLLEQTLAEATRYGFAKPQLESRLALGEMEVASGQKTAGLARLQALAAEAGRRGFALIARKARSIR
jgi:eukaryotic-like serine/threonine-protein kinase